MRDIIIRYVYKKPNGEIYFKKYELTGVETCIHDFFI